MLKNGLTAGHQSPDAKAKLTLRRGRHGGLMVDLPLRGLCILSSCLS
jgi:hypothetical protein